MGDEGGAMGVDRSDSARRERVRAMLERHWVPEGYAAPNDEVYPWQWLWDSCFHALIWAELGEPDRAVRELTSALSTQADDGFVPHMNYVRDPGYHAAFWGRRGASSITQPPMYGHAVAELRRRGVSIPDELEHRARRGLDFLLRVRRRDRNGLVLLAHPWETGCDDSPRWDDLCPGEGFDLVRWKQRKGDLVETIERRPGGAPVANRLFAVASAGFNALVAFNAHELGLDATDVVEALDARWDDELVTWVDAGDTAGGSGRARTIDGLLPTLVSRRADRVKRALGAVVEPTAYGGDCGPAGVHRDEPTFAPSRYWRGPAWPQLSYLLWVAAARAGEQATAAAIAAATVRGGDRSELAEYWDPDTGAGLGAVPQSWAGLVVLLARAGE
jgi:hypothetical protein